MSSDRAVTFKLSGVAYTAATEAGWPDDNPRGYEALRAAPPGRRMGKGIQYTITMRADDALDLAAYLQSVGDVWACMTAEERGPDRPQPIWRAVERIEEAIRS